ncbi:uncharacterized protein LOC121381514 isoform X2 [Gigantopelta aegis]|nr:uncharacterized protein LOC121381514 isoform X2 [Gigantopelta aegis]XP_041366773.1 uncharacterized protein LOC121381514 isoform X2 [Gigantopelta aegis]
MTTPVAGDVYRTPSKQVLVTRDPVFTQPTIYQGHYIGIKPPNYLWLSILVTIINPLFGPIALLFTYMSNRAYSNGDLKYSEKWSHYALLMSMITIVVSLVMYIAIGFALSPLSTKGGYAFG